MLRFPTAIVVLLVLGSACRVNLGGGDGDTTSAKTSGAPSCESKDVSYDTRVGLILALACEEGPHRTALTDSGFNRVIDIYGRFDDRHPNAIDASIIAIAISQGFAEDYLATGVGKHFVDFVAEQGLQTELAKAEVDGRAREAFLVAYRQAKATVVERASKLDSRRKHMYLDVRKL